MAFFFFFFPLLPPDMTDGGKWRRKLRVMVIGSFHCLAYHTVRS